MSENIEVNIVEEASTTVPEAAGKIFTLDECKQHATEKDCWLVIHGNVYDITPFMDEHPGGYDILLAATGEPINL
jgi:cytochrome b involved in lipid metabolism